jgi:hypothetical protein
MAFLFLFFTVVLSLCVVGLIVERRARLLQTAKPPGLRAGRLCLFPYSSGENFVWDVEP